MKQLNKIIKTSVAAIAIAVISMGSIAYAQQVNPNKLPPCPKPDYSKNTDPERHAKWTNCWGKYRVELTQDYAGDVLEGEWLNGWLHGQAIYTHVNGDKYAGDYVDGRVTGRGTYTYINGEKYVGEFKDRKMSGQGTYTYASGDKYIGEFKDDKRQGQGTLIFATGDKYVGEFLNDRFSGQGTYNHLAANQFKNDKYVGEWKDGKKHGQGIYYHLADNQFKNSKYVGEWKNDKKEGQGTFTFGNGDKYVGEFKDDKFHGQGISISADGKRVEGVWENNIFIREVKVNIPNQKNNNASNNDRNDIERERQQLAEERRRLEEEKLRQQQEASQRDNQKNNSAIPIDNRRRFALVIGNANYNSLPKLQNTINDARAISQALRSSGFRVSTHENLDLAGMQNAIRSFGEQLGKNDVGLVFYAGHGVQVKGKNYLVPVRENIKKSFEVPANALDVDLLLATLESVKNDLNIVVLDACRSPFPGESRGAAQGLATIEAGKGTFIAFATAPGKEASDGSGGNSPYTKNLSRLLAKKGLPLEQVFKEVRKSVVAETNGEQVPWENSSLMGDFYFTQ